MSEQETDELKRLLQAALPPVGETEPRRDLWPAMLKRLEEPHFRVPWWDWLLLAGASAVLLIFPGIIPALLYQL